MPIAGSTEFTFYDILGLTPKATLDEVRTAYREQARYYHPDVTDLETSIAQAKLKIINEAYETLKDNDRRRNYDLELMAQREVELWMHFPTILDSLRTEQCKVAFEYLKNLQAKVPESDMVRGLMATTFHMQARLANDLGKFQTAKKFIQQALAIPFEDPDFRRQLQADLAVADQKARMPATAGTGPVAIASQLVSPDPMVLNRAVQLAETLDPGPESSGKVIPPLWKLASFSPFREVRVGALKALLVHNQDQAESLRLLVDLYTLTKKTRTLSHQLEQDKAVLLKKLGKRAYAHIAPLMVPLIWEGTEAFRRGVVDALGEMGNPDTSPLILPLIFSQSAVMRGGAAIALDRIEGKFGMTDRLRGLVGLEGDESRAKKRLEESKKTIKKKDLVAAELRCLFWEQPAKRGEVIKAWLKEDGPENFIEYLLVSLVDKRGGVHEVAREAFVKLGPVAVGPLCSAMRDEDWLIRKLAAEILGDIKDPSSVDTLLAALDDAKPLVIKSAAHALGQVRDAKAVYPLLNLMKHEDPMVSDAASAALNRIRGQTMKM